MRCLFMIVAISCFVMPSIAADVGARQSCADIKARMDSLAAQADMSDENTAELNELRTRYRHDCVARAAGRGSRTIAASRMPVSVKTDSDTTNDDKDKTENKEEVIIADACDTPDANGCCPGESYMDMGELGMLCCDGKSDICFQPQQPAVAVVPEKTEEEIAAEIAANIEKGLCGDGTQPNKYGCCTNEIFKDLGNAVFACCKKDSDECFPPMN